MNRSLCEKIFKICIEGYNVEDRDYSINSYKEEAVCIECIDGEWCVYGGERGCKHQLRSFSLEEDAYIELINRLTYTDDDANNIITKFRNLISGLKNEEVPRNIADEVSQEIKQNDAPVKRKIK